MKDGRFREVRHGTTDELGPLRPDEASIWVSEVVAEEVWVAIGRLLRDRPDVSLRVSAGEDVEWLRFTPGLRALTADSLRLRSVEGLRHVAGTLEELSLGDSLRRVSLRPLAELQRLRRLGVNGTWNDTDTLGSLVGLERLGIGSVDLALLQPLQGLRRFTSGLGTVRSMELLPEIGALELVELYRLRGEHDLRALARIPTLSYLVLESTRSVTSLPSFAEAPHLRWVALDSMLGVTDLGPVAAAPNLEVLLLVAMCKLRVDDLRPLVGHPSLRGGIWGLCSERRNRQARDLLPLPPAPGEPMPWTQPDWNGIRHPTDT